MREELIKQSNKIVEVFVDTLLKTFDDVPKIRMELTQKEKLYQSLIEAKENELSQIRLSKRDEQENYDKKITSLENAKQDFMVKSKNYEDLSNELKRNKKETEDDLAKAKIELIRSKDIRMRAENTKEDADKFKKDYELKLDSLKIDFDKNDSKKSEQNALQKKLTTRENELFKNETRNDAKTQDLNDQELKLKAERKEIDRLIKRYSLKKE